MDSVKENKVYPVEGSNFSSLLEWIALSTNHIEEWLKGATFQNKRI